MRNLVVLMLAFSSLGIQMRAQGRDPACPLSDHSASSHYRASSPSLPGGYGFGAMENSEYAYPFNLARFGGWPGFNFGYSYLSSIDSWYSQYSNYQYFFELYSNEALRSKQEAEELESSLAREGKLTGPAKVGAFATDSLPLRSRDVKVTLDGQVQDPSPGGNPLALGSGRHTLHIGSR